MYGSLHPDHALEAPSGHRLPVQVLLVDLHPEFKAVAVHLQLIDVLICDAILHRTHYLDFPHQTVKIALHAVRHKIRIDDRINIFGLELNNRIFRFAIWMAMTNYNGYVTNNKIF